MKKEDFFEVLGELDDDIVEGAKAPMKENANGKVRKAGWIKWGTMAACLFFVIGGLAAYQFGLVGTPSHPSEEDYYIQDLVAYGFCLDGNSVARYFPISFKERVRYGLVPDDAIGLNESNIYQITKDDLGDLMGTATDCGEETINGCKVYHYVKYPENDSICIVDTPNGYKFYVCSWLNIPVEIGDVSDAFFAAYGLPNSLEKMEILAPDFQYLSDIDDENIIKAIFEILSGKCNSGLEANERRFAQAWYDAYGNDDVYYSEEAGHCVYRDVFSDEETTTYTDSEGNVMVQANSKDTSLYDKAHEFWTEGECIFQITTNRGYQLAIDYFPSIRTFICGGGYYELSTDEAESLNAFLQN